MALLGVHEGSLPFILASSPEQVGGGATAALRRRDPGQATAADFLVANPKREWAAAYAFASSSSRCCPIRSGQQPASRDCGGKVGNQSLSLHCRSCGRSLTEAAERKIGRHLDCPATFDEATMALLREWRRQEAAEQKLPAYCVFTDATLIAIAEARPRSAGRADQGAGPRSHEGRQVRRACAGDHRYRGRPARSSSNRSEPRNVQCRKVFASACDTPLGLTRIFLLDRAARPRSARLDTREEGSGAYLAHSAAQHRPELPAVSRVRSCRPTSHAELAYGRPRANLRMIARPHGRGLPSGAAQAADVQGGRIAGFGAYDVTDTKFSTRLGPPSCSPPV